MSNKQRVKVTLSFSSYNPGELCAFDPEQAEQLRQRNLVCFVDEDGNIIKKNAGQQKVEQENAAVRKRKTAELEARFIESTRRFIAEVSRDENSHNKLFTLVEDEDEQGVSEYGLSFGCVGVSVERIQFIIDENAAVKARDEAIKKQLEGDKPDEAPKSEKEEDLAKEIEETKPAPQPKKKRSPAAQKDKD